MDPLKRMRPGTGLRTISPNVDHVNVPLPPAGGIPRSPVLASQSSGRMKGSPPRMGTGALFQLLQK